MDVLLVACFTCGAKPEERCRTRSGKSTAPHSARYEDRLTQLAEQDRKYGWSERFPLTSNAAYSELLTVPVHGTVYLARLATRWKLHPSIAATVVDRLTTGNRAVYETWDPNDTGGGRFPQDTDIWWA